MTIIERPLLSSTNAVVTNARQWKTFNHDSCSKTKQKPSEGNYIHHQKTVVTQIIIGLKPKFSYHFMHKYFFFIFPHHKFLVVRVICEMLFDHLSFDEYFQSGWSRFKFNMWYTCTYAQFWHDCGERVQVKNVQHSMVNGRIKPMEYFIVIVVMPENISDILQWQ